MTAEAYPFPFDVGKESYQCLQAKSPSRDVGLYVLEFWIRIVLQ